jgi:hypothetical protein
MLLNSDNSAKSDQFFGDAIFANNFRITEAPGEPQALDFFNENGEQIASLDENGNFTVSGHLFSADNFATQDATSSVSDLITASFADASADLQSALQSIASSAVRMLGDAVYATNGIFENVFAHRVIGDELCAGSTCINQQQLAAILAANGIASSTPAGDASTTPSTNTSSSTPPVIAINGDNPAIIQVGATYTDLGATITGPQQDLNLGITRYVNGTEMNPIQIDTSAAATDTIAYVATDQSGLTSTSTRIVIVEPAPDSAESPTGVIVVAPTTASTSTIPAATSTVQ